MSKPSKDLFTPEGLHSTQPRPPANTRDNNGVPLPSQEASNPPARLPANPRIVGGTSGLGPPNRGDFAGDLNPPQNDPLLVPRPAGDLMGPNHPIFQGGGGGTPGHPGFNPADDFRSGFGMRPRFDPFRPPGGPQQAYPPGAGRHPGPGPGYGRGGDPNPDHLPPPNHLGDDMYS